MVINENRINYTSNVSFYMVSAVTTTYKHNHKHDLKSNIKIRYIWYTTSSTVLGALG